jgi:hypothetical protein
MNGYNPQLYNIDRQIQEERAKMAELERQKMQAQFSQPTILNQTIQAGPQQQGIRFAESIDDVKREMVFSDVLFVNRAFTNMWYKKPTGEVKTYLLEEFIPKDEKDIRIEALENEIKKLKENKNEPNRSDNNSTVESTVSSTVSATGTDEKK